MVILAQHTVGDQRTAAVQVVAPNLMPGCTLLVREAAECHAIFVAVGIKNDPQHLLGQRIEGSRAMQGWNRVVQVDFERLVERRDNGAILPSHHAIRDQRLSQQSQARAVSYVDQLL